MSRGLTVIKCFKCEEHLSWFESYDYLYLKCTNDDCSKNNQKLGVVWVAEVLQEKLDKLEKQVPEHDVHYPQIHPDSTGPCVCNEYNR